MVFAGGKPPSDEYRKARVGAHMAQKLLCRAVVGHIAAALAGDKDLLAGLVHVFQHRHLMPLPHGGTRRHQACRACADDQHFRHPFSLPNRLIIRVYHTRIDHTKSNVLPYFYQLQQLGKDAVLHDETRRGQGKGVAIKACIARPDAVLHKGQLCGGKFFSVKPLIGVQRKAFAQAQL